MIAGPAMRVSGSRPLREWIWIATKLVSANHTLRVCWRVAAAVLRILCFAAALGFGSAITGRRNWVNLFGGALAGSVLFYLVTNTSAWAGDLGYSHTLAGWWQAVTVGHPQYYPTIFFFRNTLMSDLFFTGCFALAMEYASLRRGGPSLLGLKQVGR